MPATVGCIGLGDMGGAMSETIAASYDLTVFDLSEEAGAKVVDKGARAAESGAGPAPTLRPLSGSPRRIWTLRSTWGWRVAAECLS